MNLKSMFRKLAPFAALLGLGSPAYAEEAVLDRSDADPALWVLSDDDTTIYLFGTMHALKTDLVWFDDAVADAFGKSDELVLEMIPPPPEEMAGFVQTAAIAKPGSGLSTILTEDQYARFAAAASSIGLPAQMLEPMQPWFAGVTLATAPLQQLGYSAEAGAEQVLQTAAAKRSMQMVGLETFEQQMGFFTGLSQEDQIAFLMAGVDDMGEMKETFENMETAWAMGDTKATADLLNEGMEDTPKLHEVLLKNRNAAWAKWIGTRMESPGTVFIAVGAGHLAGDDSVQSMLAAKGFTATRIEY